MFDREKAEEAFRRRYGVTADWHTFAEFNEKCEALPLGCNMAPLIGYSAVRVAVMGGDCLRPASKEELPLLEHAVADCMEAGAFGLSSGRDPIYLPGPFFSSICPKPRNMRRFLEMSLHFYSPFAIM